MDQVPRRGRPVTSPIIKKPGQPGGFVPIPYPNALDLASRRFAEIRARYGEAAVGVIGRASRTAVAVEAEVVLLASRTLGEMVQLLVASGRIDVEVITEVVPAVSDAALRPIASARELVRAIDAGEIKGLVSICLDSPRGVPLGRALDKLEFHLAVDSVLGSVARRADLVLPLDSRAEGSLAESSSLPRSAE